MPTIPDIPGPYRLFFYSFDCVEPAHVHVERNRSTCKFWLRPLALAANSGLPAHEVNRIRRLISKNVEEIQNAWDEHCGGA